jgi:Zn ribbon nucleic-acid-binding protein
MTDQEVYEILTKLYTKKLNGWFITGYKCPYCGHHYHTLRKEIYNHVRNCEGIENSRSLED